MQAGDLYGKVPNVLADSIRFTTVVVPGSGSSPALLSSLIPSGVFNGDFALAGARLTPAGADITIGHTDDSLPKTIVAEETYSPPVSNWTEQVYVRAAGSGSVSCTLELFLSQVSRDW